jgi:hypothetical protein
VAGVTRDMKNNQTEKYQQDLKLLRDKADMLASIHSHLSDRYSTSYTIITSVLLVISTLLVGLTFVSDQFIQVGLGINADSLKWIVGIVSILNFSGVMLLAEWKFQDKSAQHREAVRFYFGIVNRIRRLLDTKQEITEDIIEEIRTEYGRTQGLPKIPDSRFLKLKQWHLQKVAISRELSNHPFETVSAIKKRLKNNTTVK